MRPEGLAVSLAGFPGAATALVELAAATGLLQAVTIQRADPRGREVRFVQSLLTRDWPKLLVFGGWSAAYAPIVRAARRRSIPVAVYWTSTAGQTGIGRETDRLNEVLEASSITHRWFASRPLADSMTDVIVGAAWLPIVLASTRRPRRPKAVRRTSERLQVSLFCSPHEYPRKNVLSQLLGLSQSGVPCRLHLNGLPDDPLYRSMLDRLSLDWIDHGWMPRASYLETLTTLDLGLQVSFAESFNYVAADHLLAGVPVLASPMVPVIADMPGRLSDAFVVARPDDSGAIASAIRRLWRQPRRAAEQTMKARAWLLADLRRREKMASCLLSDVLRRA